MNALSADQKAAIRKRYEKACAEMDRLTRAPGGPGGSWRWSIPADPERDSDLILSRPIGDVVTLLAEVDRLAAREQRVRELHKGMHQCGLSWYTDDPKYRGSIATKGKCETICALDGDDR